MTTDDTPTATSSANDDVAELARRIHGIRFAMLTLPDARGQLRGRPLTVQDVDFDGSLWFLVSRSSDWTDGVGDGAGANAAFSDPSDSRWVSIAGTARLVDDPARVKEMWSPLYEAWFDGPDDPDLTLLRFDADLADYWDSESSRIVRLAKLAIAAVTGGEHGGLDGDRGTLTP